MRLLFFLILSTFSACTPISQSSVNSAGNPKILKLEDAVYEETIRTVTLHPSHNDPQANLLPAVAGLNAINLLLQFDELTTQRDNYYARIIHCNYDWTRSSLLDLDFLSDFNEFPINNFEFSADSHIPYVHYWFQLPNVKLPGNYVLMVYRGSSKEDVILTKRFMVFDSRVSFENERNLLGAGTVASLNQQINFTINYPNLDLINPMENVKVVIRQNQRWDNLVTDLKPSFIREAQRQIEYRFFDDARMFKGGNEFRFFDLRSLNNPGRNVQRVNRTTRPVEVFIERDKSRQREAYSQYLDMNGGYLLDNFDYRDATFANYAWVNFTLVSPPVQASVFVTGAFSQWGLTDENRMQYDSTSSQYQARILLKQGWYDYQYLAKGRNIAPYFFEGSHYQTENMYEIFVYYMPLQPRADMLIGYMRLEKNPR